MQDEKRMSTTNQTSTKQLRKKYAFKDKKKDIFDTSNADWKVISRIIVFVIFACFSSITISAKITFPLIVSHALSNHLNNTFPNSQMEWIGQLYSVMVLCLLPITTSIIDHWMISYRFSLVISGTLHLVACITNSTITHPLFFVLTDSLICGLGSAITFSVFFLAIDDLFPRGNPYRVLTTTLCQGSTVFSLFIAELLSLIANDWGWLIFQLSLAAILFVEAVMLIAVCPEYGMNINVKRRGGPSLISNEAASPSVGPLIKEPSPVISNKLLGLTFVEINRSPSMFSFLVYRFSMSIIHQGISMLVLVDSRIIKTPNIETLFSRYFPTTTAALAYATGETIIFIFGALFGVFLLGYLLHINIALLCLLFLVSVIWQPIRLQVMSQSMVIGHIVCAGIAGCCIGGLDTCLTTLSEEGTAIHSRRIYPFVKLLEGLAYTFAPFLLTFLNTVSEKNVWLLTFALMAAANACLLVFILHKLYISYRSNPGQHKTTMQVSMKPIHLFTTSSE